jgi:hypothetical protein
VLAASAVRRHNGPVASDATVGRPAAGAAAVVGVLAVIIVGLLSAGVAGAVVHRRGSSGAPATPVGFQRVVDTNDRISVAVPAGWQARVLPAEALEAQVRDLAAIEPQLAGLSGLTSVRVRNPRLGVYSKDPSTQIQMLTIGFDAPGIHSVAEIPVAEVTGPLQSAGASHIATTPVHLPVGKAEQVTNQLTIGTATVTESLVYFLRSGRAVEIVLVAPGPDPPRSLLRQIEATVSPA